MLLSTLAASLASDIQPYGGLQLRMEQSFLDLIGYEFYHQLPYVINDVIAPLVPEKISLFLGFVQILDIRVFDFTIDESRGKMTIDEGKRGIMMNWPTVKTWNIHFQVLYILVWPIEYWFDCDIKVRDATLDNGLSLQADTHSGAPIVNFFNTYINLGGSYIELTGDFVVYIIGWFSNIFKAPIQILINEFFEPFVNFVVNSIVIPDFLNNGLLHITEYVDGKLVDELILDITLPQQPVFHGKAMDVFDDAAVYFEKKGKAFASPSTPMRFQLEQQNFQLVLSTFSVNQVIETAIDTGYLSIPLSHTMVYDLSGFELTSTLLFAVVPEVFYTYGHRNMTLVLAPQPGTQVMWSVAEQATLLDAKLKIGWMVHEDEFDQVTDLAFESTMDVTIKLTIDQPSPKNLTLGLKEIKLTNFNVTQDNCEAKSDEAGIGARLDGVMEAVGAVIDGVLQKTPLLLPEFDLVDYTIKTEYQDSALGIGANLFLKK